MTRKPDFFIVGAGKSGTTSLYHYLQQHPHIWMPKFKEPHYFGEYRPPGYSEITLQEYLSLFAQAPRDLRVGEASTFYLYSPSAAQQIKDFCPLAKIIIILRNPISRAYSHYWFQVRNGRESSSFEEVVKAEIENTIGDNNDIFPYLSLGCYYNQIKRYYNNFKKEQIKILLFDDLKDHTSKTCSDIFSFLEIDPNIQVKTSKIFNRSGVHKSKLIAYLINPKIAIKKPLRLIIPLDWRIKILEFIIDKNIKPAPPMDEQTKNFLKEYYKDEILNLELLLERDLRSWLY